MSNGFKKQTKLNGSPCLNDKLSKTDLNKKDRMFLKRLKTFVEDNLTNPDFNIEKLAGHMQLSRSHLYRRVKVLTNLSVGMYIKHVRLHAAYKEILKGNKNISEICYMVGFNSPSYFTKCFKEYYGTVPTKLLTD